MKTLILILIPTIVLAQGIFDIFKILDFFKMFPPKFPKPVLGPQFKYGAVSEEGGLPNVSCWEYGIEGCIFYFFIAILSIIYPVALFAGVIMFVLAGIWYITGWKKAEEVHKVLMWGVVGLVVAVLSLSIVKGIEAFIEAPLFPYLIIE